MPGEEIGGNGTEEEFKASLLRQWKEGRLQVAEGRQIPTIIEHRNLRQRQSWPLPTVVKASLPDLSQPPPGFSYIQAQPTLPLPMPSSLPLPVSMSAPQPQPGGQYREQVLKALLAGTQLGEVVDALLAVPSSMAKTPADLAPTAKSRSVEISDQKKPQRRQESESVRKRIRDPSEGDVVLMRESSNSSKRQQHIGKKSRESSGRDNLREIFESGKLCDRPGRRNASEESRRSRGGRPGERSRSGQSYERFKSSKPRERSRSGRRMSCIGKFRKRSGSGNSHEKSRGGECRERSPSEPDGRPRNDRKEAERHHERIQREMRNDKSLRKVDLATSSQRDLKMDYPSVIKVEKESVAIMAVVKHLIDSRSGLLELFQEGERKAVLFHKEQVHLDRDGHDLGSRSCNARPTSNSRQFQEAMHPGQRVLVIVQHVEAKLVALQAVALWLRGCRMPRFSINQRKMKEQLKQFMVFSSRNVLPLCLDGLPKGEYCKWTAKVKKVVDDEWGLVEVKAAKKQGKLRCFLCLFHKSDVWLSSGDRVPDQRYFRQRSLREIVAINQPVTLAARSLLKEKGSTMMGALDASVEMQALWVSLNPSSFPPRVARAVRMEKGPGSLGGSKWTPCMFEAGLEERLGEQLRKYVKASGRTLRGLDPDLNRWIRDIRFDLRLELQGRESRRERRKEKPGDDEVTALDDVTIVEDVENNVEGSWASLKLESLNTREEKGVCEIEVKPEVEEIPTYLDLQEGRVVGIIDDNFGMIKHYSNGHQVLFDTCDLWVTKETTAAASSKVLSSVLEVGDPVKFHAVLVQTSVQPHYLATAVWRVVEGAPIYSDGLAPAAIRKDAIHKHKIDIFKTVTRISALKQMDTSLQKSLPNAIVETKLPKVKALGEVKQGKGNLASILNPSFGLIRFGSSFCLFDTFDLFLETGKTAAQSRLTVTNCLTVGMEVYFHAVELEGGGRVRWLATGVWRPASLDKDPQPVDRQKISAEKMDVFKQVTSMCSVLVANLVNCPIEENQVQMQDRGVGSVEGESVDASNEMEKEKPIKVVTDIVSDILAMAVGGKRNEEDFNHEVSEELLETRTDNVKIQRLEDIEYEGVLEQVLGAKFGLVMLQGGEKALLRKNRLWVAGSLPGEWRWEEVKVKKLFCKVRKLNLDAQVSYQVTYAYTGIESIGESVKSPALVRFVENKEDEEVLDRELKKYQEL